ncbi:CTP synthase [Candidatus Beckwithbacteria bacterium RBG_13_42_9]|uniref:CTP synthase n=1 Tax=Candidatus Beckwithbacteria bacterium RBG_13_42_9 TaxID=1797457 RepID=A0A1F5E6B6_9BACT|nr:MAG: CTP synthase [Candidatus Beckwithbacteria bacterium RBG_13_42_9]
MPSKTKYIFVSGGVISGLGKGVTAGAIAFLLKSHGLKVTTVKCDAYVNIDAGTIRPQEHGEVFVTEDGIETDQDLGHYERFLHENLKRANYITLGQIFQEVIRRERNFEYHGEDVEVVPDIPNEMIRRFRLAAKETGAEVVIIEIGGTVGEYQNILFLEANRLMKFRDNDPVLHIHVAYLPTPKHIGEMKSKPVQTSVRLLNQTMIQPDFLVCRAEKPIDAPRRARLSIFCNVSKEDIISNPYVGSIYEVPTVFKEQDFDQKILTKLGIKKPVSKIFSQWQAMLARSKSAKKTVKIGLVGKYQKIGDYTLPDAYVCVVEAVKHAAWSLNLKPEIVWFDAEEIEKGKQNLNELLQVGGVIVPQGWGSRGVEGKIKAIQFVREHRIPYLGLCFGMQMAVIEFARNVMGLSKANSEEANVKTPYPVIHIMPNQKEYLAKHQYGGTIRLGAWPCKLIDKTMAKKLYQQFGWLKDGQTQVAERHRHRYEFNLKYKDQFEKNGLRIAGISPDGKLVEVIELDQKLHPFFIGVQFHPEYKSRPLSPHPLFIGLIKTAHGEKFGR